jgi:hypothetical protein
MGGVSSCSNAICAYHQLGDCRNAGIMVCPYAVDNSYIHADGPQKPVEGRNLPAVCLISGGLTRQLVEYRPSPAGLVPIPRFQTGLSIQTQIIAPR